MDIVCSLPEPVATGRDQGQALVEQMLDSQPGPVLRRVHRPTGANRASHGERWLSAIGGFIGIAGLLWISGGVLDLEGAVMVLASMGATAVLLFAVMYYLHCIHPPAGATAMVAVLGGDAEVSPRRRAGGND